MNGKGIEVPPCKSFKCIGLLLEVIDENRTLVST
jgi:hypothetical protein